MSLNGNLPTQHLHLHLFIWKQGKACCDVRHRSLGIWGGVEGSLSVQPGLPCEIPGQPQLHSKGPVSENKKMAQWVKELAAMTDEWCIHMEKGENQLRKRSYFCTSVFLSSASTKSTSTHTTGAMEQYSWTQNGSWTSEESSSSCLARSRMLLLEGPGCREKVWLGRAKVLSIKSMRSCWHGEHFYQLTILPAQYQHIRMYGVSDPIVDCPSLMTSLLFHLGQCTNVSGAKLADWLAADWTLYWVLTG